MKKRLIITEDITDWRDECLREEVEITSVSDLIELVIGAGYSNAQAARFAIVMRELGAAPGDILRTNKMLLNAGGRAEIATRISNHKTEVEMPNGQMRQVRTYVASPGRKPELDDEENDKDTTMKLAVEYVAPDDGNSKGYAQFDSERGIELALHWLCQVVPGHIFERLKQIAAVNGDVVGAADALKSIIDEMVERLIEPDCA